jgi:hypothetical protein
MKFSWRSLKGRFEGGNIREYGRIIKSDREVIGLMQYNKFVWLEMGCNAK